jgi:DNA-binding MarR family transcriptional regulator
MATGDTSDAARVYLFVQHVGRRLRQIDGAHGLTAARFSVLASVVMHANSTVTTLAADERVKAPSMTRLLRDMERDGLVSRRGNPDDRRGVLVAATAKGEAAFWAARREKIAMIETHLQALPIKQRAAVSVAFAALEGWAAEVAEPPP